jgi:hypothetical protein
MQLSGSNVRSGHYYYPYLQLYFSFKDSTAEITKLKKKKYFLRQLEYIIDSDSGNRLSLERRECYFASGSRLLLDLAPQPGARHMHSNRDLSWLTVGVRFCWPCSCPVFTHKFLTLIIVVGIHSFGNKSPFVP